MSTATVTLIDVECICGVAYAIPLSLYNNLRKTGEDSCCPLGHKWHYSESLEAKYRTLQLQLQQKDNLIAEERRERQRIEDRIIKGVCPYCKRMFRNVQRHMSCKHKD